MSGLNPPSGLRLGEPPTAPEGDDLDVLLDDLSIDSDKNVLEVKLPDGSIIVNLGSPETGKPKSDKFDDNLADELDDSELGTIADDLLRGVEADDQSRSEWLATRTAAIEMLGFKLEKPGSGSAGEPAGISKVRHPVIAEAVIRGSATAQAELLPSDGPVKVRNDDPNAQAESDLLADALQKDMNHFLTEIAKEYYPDTRRMLFLTYLGGCGFRKAYHDPIRNRPVLESIEAENVIVSNAAINIESAARVTHRFYMRPSTLKRMQILGAYRDIDIEDPAMVQKGVVEQAKENISGVRTNQSNEPGDREYEMFEVYCELDIPGFEHKGKNREPDGLALPYRVVIEKNSRKILEIRRNWEEGDKLCIAKNCIVKFSFLQSFGFYDIGLAQILGNLAMALTAGVREGLDAGMFACFPGGLIAKQGTRQNSSDVRVAPGQLAPVDTGGMPIKDAVMALPYKEMGPGLMSLIQYLADTASRLGGAADIQVGEGRQDAPVGTTIALIEQATKPMDAVHKGLVTSQGEEFKLLVGLLREDPDAIYMNNRLPSRFLEIQSAAGLPTPQDAAVARNKFKWNRDQFLKALADYDLVPAADPNTSSSVQRAAKAQVVYQMAKDNPLAFKQQETYKYVFKQLGVSSAESLLQDQAAGPPPDPKAEAAVLNAQAKGKEAEAKLGQVQVDHLNAVVDGQNRAEDRDARERNERLKFEGEMVKASADRQHEHQIADKKINSDHALAAHDAHHDRGMMVHQALEDRLHKAADLSNKPSVQ